MIRPLCAATPPPQAPQQTIQLSAYLQDSYVEGPEPTTVQLDQRKCGDRLNGPRIETRDPEKARADADGNYLHQPPTGQFDQVTAFAAAQATLDLAEQLADQPIPWAFRDEQLKVEPHHGEGMNAYYVRQNEAVEFYHFESRPLNRHIQVAQCADVVAHETGHAILDGLKPEFLYDWGDQSRAFHEAFGDCMAILTACSKPQIVERALAETEGDLLKENPISRMAEEFGLAWRKEWNPYDSHPYLRNALNEHKYVPMNQLPENGPVDSLNRQPHSYSQIFTGAFYRCLATMAQTSGLEQASQDLGRVFLHATEMTAPSSTTFKEVARCMLTADRMLYEGSHTEQLKQVFLERELLTQPELDQWQNETIPGLSKTSDPMRFLRRHQETLKLDAWQYRLARTSTDRQNRERWEFLSYKRDVQGGLTLTFEPSGRLGWISRQDITPERLEEAQKAIEKLRPDQIGTDTKGYLAEIQPDGTLRRTTWLKD